jgi:capsular polysaccharide export protein
VLVWAGKAPPALAVPGLTRRVEDGFLRSRGLGADLVPPLSLVTDDLGIYYDPTRESRLERLMQTPLPPGGRARAERLLTRLLAAKVTKYNLGRRRCPILARGGGCWWWVRSKMTPRSGWGRGWCAPTLAC